MCVLSHPAALRPSHRNFHGSGNGQNQLSPAALGSAPWQTAAQNLEIYYASCSFHFGHTAEAFTSSTCASYTSSCDPFERRTTSVEELCSSFRRPSASWSVASQEAGLCARQGISSNRFSCIHLDHPFEAEGVIVTKRTP